MSREVVIVDAVSTPFGAKTKVDNGFKAAKKLFFQKGYWGRAAMALVHLSKPEYGAFDGMTPIDLAAVPILDILARQNGRLDPALVNDVILGCVVQTKGQGMNIARLAALSAGLPDRVPGLTVSRLCASSQSAVTLAHAKIAAGQADVIIAGGVEHMNAAPMMADAGPISKGLERRMKVEFQHISAELIAQKWEFSREELDRFGASSFMRYAAARKAGYYRSFTSVVKGTFSGKKVSLEEHEGVRHGKTFEETLKTAKGLQATFGRVAKRFNLEEARLTAMTSSREVDGASAVLLMTKEMALKLGLTPKARIVQSWALGSDPNLMLTGPIESTRECFARAGMKVDQIAHWEINEAFASVVLAVAKDLGLSLDRVNAWGGAIAHGHPLGATGGALVAKLIAQLGSSGAQYAAQTMCVGFGQAETTIFENLQR